MSNEKKAFLIYLDYRQKLELLTVAQRDKLLFAVFDYEEFKKQPDFSTDPMVDLVWLFFKSNLDRDRVKYDKRCETSKENGKKGGAPKGNKNARKQPNQPKQPDKDIDTVKEIEKDIDTETEKETDTDIVRGLFPSPIFFDEPLSLSIKQYRQVANKFHSTAWLRDKFKHISTIHENFKKIVTGKYDSYTQQAKGDGLISGTVPVLSEKADKYSI